MAIIKMGAIVTDIKGKLGGHVFQGGKGGSSMRTAKFKGGKTLKDVVDGPGGVGLRMGSFNQVTSTWRNLTVAKKATWLDLVGTWTFKNKFGVIVNRNAYAIFTACNINRLLLNSTILEEAPIPVSAFPLFGAVTFDASNVKFIFTPNNAEANGQYVIIRQAPAVNKEKLAPSKPYVVIYSGITDGTTPIDITANVMQPSVIAGPWKSFFKVETVQLDYPKVGNAEYSIIQN